MKKLMSLTLVLLFAISLACGFNISTARITEAILTRDEAGQEATTRFKQDETFYAQVELANAPDDTSVRAVWTAVEVAGTPAKAQIDETTLTSGDGQLTFSLSNDQLWPPGAYELALYLNDDLDQTLTFEVEEALAVAPTSTPEPTPTPEPTATPTATPVSVTETVTIPTEFETYVDPDGRFELDLPVDWKVEGDPGNVLAGAENGKAFVGVVALPGESVLSEAELQTYGQDFLDLFFGLAQGEVTINGDNLEADGSYSYDVTIDTPEGVLEALVYVEQRGIDLFHLIVLAEQDLWPDFSATFEQIISSYRVTPYETTEFLSDLLPLTDYTDPDELFYLKLPEDWEIDPSAGSVTAMSPDGEMVIFGGAFPTDLETLDEADAKAYLNELLSNIYNGLDFEIEAATAGEEGGFALNYVIDPEGLRVLGLAYIDLSGGYLFTLGFQSPSLDWPGMIDTFQAINDSYVINPSGSAAGLPDLSITPPSLGDSAAPEPGRARLLVFNELAAEDLTLSLPAENYTVPARTIDQPLVIDLDPGTYTYTISIEAGSLSDVIELAADETWTIGLQADKRVYEPVRVYPED